MGLKIEYANAVAMNVVEVFAQEDVQNAHNEYDRVKAQEEIIAAAYKNPKLIKLAIAHESISKGHNPIYMRSSQSKSGFSHICNSERGGGQGNALSGLIFVLTIDRALKDIEAHFPGVKVKAIHDDITLIGPPEMIFGEDKSMMFLEKRLKLKGLMVN